MSSFATACLYLLSGFAYCPANPPERGYGSQYAIGPMEATVALRQSWWPDSRLALPPDLSPWSGHVASLSCDDIGMTYLVRVYPSKIWRPYLVSDCAGHVETFIWMRDLSILLEFGGVEAAKLGITGLPPGQVGIEVVKLPRSIRLPQSSSAHTFSSIGEQQYDRFKHQEIYD